MEDYGICAEGNPKVGGEIVVGEGEQGVVPKCFPDSGKCFVRLKWVGGYFNGGWEIVPGDEAGIVCFVPDWFAGKEIRSVKIESERPKSFVGKPISFMSGGTLCLIK